MAPRERAKPNTRARVRGVATQFGELDLTPTQPQSHPVRENEKSQPPQVKAPAEEHQTVEDLFEWSDGASANAAARSSSVNPGDMADTVDWDFDVDIDDGSLPPLSSQNVGNSDLPDTIPLVREGQAGERPGEMVPKVDFSETASTVHRSTPLAMSDTVWEFPDSPYSDKSSPVTGTINNRHQKETTSPHLHADELYDATPKKPQSKDKSSAKARPKTKKPRQRAKEPVKVDPITHEIVGGPCTKKTTSPPKMPIVSALRESAKESISPIEKPQKKARKAPQKEKQKQQKPRQRRAAKKPKTEANTTQRIQPAVQAVDPIILNSSPPKAIAESPSVCLQEVASIEPQEMDWSPDMDLDDLPGAVQESSVDSPMKSIEFTKPVEFTKPTEFAKPVEPVERVEQPKRRRPSRQFSVSEKGSPVVAKPAAHIDRVYPTVPIDPFRTMGSGPKTDFRSLSFPKTTTNDRRQHEHALGDMEAKAPLAWLPRISSKKTEMPHKPNVGQKLHDEIMKSFLSPVETEAGPQETRPAPSIKAANASLAAAQIRQITEVRGVQSRAAWRHGRLTTRQQLVDRLTAKKTAASSVAEVYRKRGTESVTHMKQECMNDYRSLAEKFCEDGRVFGERLQVVKESIEAHSSVRGNWMTGLGETMKVRHQVYSQALSSLRAMRDEFAGADGISLR